MPVHSQRTFILTKRTRRSVKHGETAAKENGAKEYREEKSHRETHQESRPPARKAYEEACPGEENRKGPRTLRSSCPQSPRHG